MKKRVRKLAVLASGYGSTLQAVINTHPSLLPKYGGKGMHGMHIHAEVVKNHEEESGVTLHFVNEEYDKGQIIWQTHVPVYAEDCAKDVSDRVQAAGKDTARINLKSLLRRQN